MMHGTINIQKKQKMFTLIDATLLTDDNGVLRSTPGLCCVRFH